MSVVIPSQFKGAYASCRDELMEALLTWDFTGVFPSGYEGNTGVEFTTNWPDARIEEMQTTNNGQMTQPIISLVVSHHTDQFRSLGQVTESRDPIPPDGTKRLATRIGVAVLVSSWADELLGGYGTVEAMAGNVEACVFLNQRKLPTFRHLRCHGTEPTYSDRPGIFTYDLHVEGDVLLQYDVPLDW